MYGEANRNPNLVITRTLTHACGIDSPTKTPIVVSQKSSVFKGLATGYEFSRERNAVSPGQLLWWRVVSASA